MSCFTADVKKLFQQAGRSETCEELESSYKKHLERRTEFVEYGDPDKLSTKTRARLNCRVIQQTLLHRAERLIASSGTAILEKNIYALALLVRGHVEGTAVLGYLCTRLRTLTRDKITIENFSEGVADTISGARHDLFSDGTKSVNILTCVKKADDFIDEEFKLEKKEMLKEGYNWLSEFAHPNFLSHSGAFSLDKTTNRFVFHHDRALEDGDFQHAIYLSISADLFLPLFDWFGKQMEITLAE
jgi:hypothetical protein